jgi:two-component system, LytTR family, sensor histidine kinase AlgZ
MHLSFWCVYLSFFIYQVSAFQRSPEINWLRVFTVVTIQVSFAMAIGYLNYFIFLPRFLKNRKAWRYILELGTAFAILITARIYLERYLIDGFTHQERYLYAQRFLFHVITTNIFIVVFLSMIRFAVDWFEFEANRKSAENERLLAELNFLKAQINPHFLFNTLNNLYYLAYTQSPNTTEVIAKLSQMMRYMIYDSNYLHVPLTKEIEYMQNYISLERLRLNDQIPIKFDIHGPTEGVLIAPLIFITFLENAFKHGVSNHYPGAWVNISIHMRGKECIYRVENSKLNGSKPEANEKSGIGLQNVKRRLELSYPERHELMIEDKPDRYSVELKITL